MWCVDPSRMCRQHLLGEWKELAQLVGHVRAGNVGTVVGHAVWGQVSIDRLPDRYRELREEMQSRGYRTDLDLTWFDVDGFYSFLRGIGWVNVERNEEELSRKPCGCQF